MLQEDGSGENSIKLLKNAITALRYPITKTLFKRKVEELLEIKIYNLWRKDY